MTNKLRQINEYAYLGESTIHNKGIFASKKILLGTKIIQYCGELISKSEGTRREEASLALAKKDPNRGGTYIFEVDEENDLDGDTENNYAKYANHSCEPNCEFIVKDKEVWIYSKREINSDEELLVNYGIEWNPKEYFKFPCRCGSPKCVGYILEEDDWPKLKEYLKK
ncbi:MAG: SET domain-containing protein-lysine N-methyltransferase [archaeon]|jgi:hypothetical protein